MFVQTTDKETVWMGEADSFRDIVEALTGVVAFERVAWREAVVRAARERISLARAPLRGMDLSGIDLRRQNLTGADLRGARLRDAWLDGSVLTAADLTGADISGARLGSCSMMDSVLSSVAAVGAIFDRADMRRSRLDGGIFRSATFVGAKLVGAMLDGACLVGADFTSAVLGSASIRHAELTGCTWDLAIVFAANFSGSVLSHDDLARAADAAKAVVPERRLEEAIAGSRARRAAQPVAARRETLARVDRFFAEEAALGRDRVTLLALGVNLAAWLDRRPEAEWGRLAVSSTLELLFEASRTDAGVHKGLTTLYGARPASKEGADVRLAG